MAEERVQRRLAAILAADVVGYSRLMGEDEEGSLDALKTTPLMPTANHLTRFVSTNSLGFTVYQPLRHTVASQGCW